MLSVCCRELSSPNTTYEADKQSEFGGPSPADVAMLKRAWSAPLAKKLMVLRMIT